MILGHTLYRSHGTLPSQAFSHFGWEIFLMRVSWVLGYTANLTYALFL